MFTIIHLLYLLAIQADFLDSTNIDQKAAILSIFFFSFDILKNAKWF